MIDNHYCVATNFLGCNPKKKLVPTSCICTHSSIKNYYPKEQILVGCTQSFSWELVDAETYKTSGLAGLVDWTSGLTKLKPKRLKKNASSICILVQPG